MTVCSVPGCEREVLARGWCRSHYMWARRNGWAEPRPETGPRVGDPSGFGTYGVMERQWASALCHECGGWYESVGSHAYMVHEMTAAEYRQVHGLPRTQSLASLALSAELSRQARDRLGTPGWQRLEAARDPLAASQARGDDALRRSRPAVRAKRKAEAGERLPARRPRQGRICPACGTPYAQPRGTCGDPACVSALKAEAARQEAAARFRPPTEAEVAELRAIGADDVAGLGPVVRRLYRDRVSAAAIGRVLGRSGAWMTKHFPSRDAKKAPPS